MKISLLATSVSLLLHVSAFAGDPFTPGKYSCVYQRPNSSNPDPQDSPIQGIPLILQAGENGFMGIGSKKAVILWGNAPAQSLDPTQGSLGSLPDGGPGAASIDQELEGEYNDPALHFMVYEWKTGWIAIDNRIVSGGVSGRVRSFINDGNYDNPGGNEEADYICTREL